MEARAKILFQTYALNKNEYIVKYIKQLYSSPPDRALLICNGKISEEISKLDYSINVGIVARTCNFWHFAGMDTPKI